MPVRKIVLALAFGLVLCLPACLRICPRSPEDPVPEHVTPPPTVEWPVVQPRDN